MQSFLSSVFSRDDLRYWLTENREELKLGSPDVIEKHADIRATVFQVQKQQEDIMEKLFMEQTRLEDELRTGQYFFFQHNFLMRFRNLTSRNSFCGTVGRSAKKKLIQPQIYPELL